MPRSPEDMERIKMLFKKLYDAYRFVDSHPAIDYPEQFKAVISAVDGWVEELEALGVNKLYSLCIYTFGSDYQIAYNLLRNQENLTSSDSS